MKRRVVVTGMGAVTPIGGNVEEMWSAARAGICGIRRLSLFDASKQRASLAAEADVNLAEHFDPAEARRLDRSVSLAVIAGRQALSQAGINIQNSDKTRCGVLVASGIGGLGTITREHARGVEKGFDRVSPYFIPMSICNMPAGRLAIESGFHGYSASVVTACAGGANAIGDAMRAIRHGYADVMLCGGTEACLIPLSIGGFTSMKALHLGDDPARASIPFDAERSGFVLGEGAGILVLEERERALSRGAPIIAEILGYAATCDAYHITAPEPEGINAARAMCEAMSDAEISARDIGYINAHGTSTPMNDKVETAAIKSVFGDAAMSIAVSSTKSMTGHMLGAAGAVEAIICALALRDGFIPATINYRRLDPECDLDVVPNAGRNKEFRYAMSNSLGFGGHNASLIIAGI